MRDAGLQPPALEVVVPFLVLPSGGAAPFGEEALAVGLDGGDGLVVGGFEEVGDAEDGEF